MLLLNPAEKEISEISKISAPKAVGPNSIPNSILIKEYKDILKVPLTIIIKNISFMIGRFPKQCKTTHITPAYKKGDELDTSNYRPISRLSNIKSNLVFEIPIQLIMCQLVIF